MAGTTGKECKASTPSLFHVDGDNRDMSGRAASNESLELSRDDYIGQRHMLTTMLLKVGRYDAALVLCQLWLDPKYDRQTFKRLQYQQQLPSFDPLPARVVEYHRTIDSEDVCELFNAAFRIRGDCELARQCLRLGHELNPHMTKILAQVERPGQQSSESWRLALTLHLSEAIYTSPRSERTRRCT